MYQQLRKFINIIDELRDLGVSKVIRLPRIASNAWWSAVVNQPVNPRCSSLLWVSISCLEEKVFAHADLSN